MRPRWGWLSQACGWLARLSAGLLARSGLDFGWILASGFHLLGFWLDLVRFGLISAGFRLDFGWISAWISNFRMLLL